MPIFAGTRVPIKNLFDAIIGGDTISAFLDDFPTVSLRQVEAVLSEAAHPSLDRLHRRLLKHLPHHARVAVGEI